MDITLQPNTDTAIEILQELETRTDCETAAREEAGTSATMIASTLHRATEKNIAKISTRFVIRAQRETAMLISKEIGRETTKQFARTQKKMSGQTEIMKTAPRKT